MDEELDYMSDDFIINCFDSANDVRSGLLQTHTQRREHNLSKKKIKNKKKRTAVLQAEVREESLKQPIQATNKGFSMLQKMGFKAGMGLGKNNSGITEPIEVNVKNDKKGLGHKSASRKKPVRKSKAKLEERKKIDFRAFLNKKNKTREAYIDLRKSQRACRELDLKCDKNVPEESWFWPREPPKSEEKADDDDDGDADNPQLNLTNSEKLKILTKYLRENYFYCIWCKMKYEDEKDMEDCPGPTSDDH